MAEPVGGEVHRHFKGADKKYFVFGVAYHVDTQKKHVVYMPLYGENAGIMLLRDYDEWLTDVENHKLETGETYSGDRFWPLAPQPTPKLG